MGQTVSEWLCLIFFQNPCLGKDSNTDDRSNHLPLRREQTNVTIEDIIFIHDEPPPKYDEIFPNKDNRIESWNHISNDTYSSNKNKYSLIQFIFLEIHELRWQNFENFPQSLRFG